MKEQYRNTCYVFHKNNLEEAANFLDNTAGVKWYSSKDSRHVFKHERSQSEYYAVFTFSKKDPNSTKTSNRDIEGIIKYCKHMHTSKKILMYPFIQIPSNYLIY